MSSSCFPGDLDPLVKIFVKILIGSQGCVNGALSNNLKTSSAKMLEVPKIILIKMVMVFSLNYVGHLVYPKFKITGFVKHGDVTTTENYES